jgi:hypothetical protein
MVNGSVRSLSIAVYTTWSSAIVIGSARLTANWAVIVWLSAGFRFSAMDCRKVEA